MGPVPPGIYDCQFDVDGLRITDPASPNVFGNRQGSRGYVEVPGPAGHPRARRVARRAAWDGHHPLVHLEGDRRSPPGPCLCAAGLPAGNLQAVSGAVLAARLRRQRLALDAAWPGQRDRRQPAGRWAGRADDHRHARWPRRRSLPRAGRGQAGIAGGNLSRKTCWRACCRWSRRITASWPIRSTGGSSACRWAAASRSASGSGHLDQFAWVGAFSSAVSGDDPALAALRSDPAAANQKLKLLWIAIGKDDFLLARNRDFVKALDELKIRHTFQETAGNVTPGAFGEVILPSSCRCSFDKAFREVRACKTPCEHTFSADC